MEPSETLNSVVVVGAGIVGLSIALRLQMDGYQVTVIDKCEPMSGVSFGNAGYLSEANIFPPATPDVLRQLPRLMLARNGPIVLRPSYAFRFISWAWRAKAALLDSPRKHVMSSMASLTSVAITAFDELTKEASAEHLITRNGGLLAFKTEAALDAKCRALSIWNSHGLAAERLTAGAVRELEPALSDSIVGGIFYPNAGRCSNPRALGEHYALRLRERGAAILPDEVRALRHTSQGQVEVVTRTGSHIAGRVIVAAGYSSKDLLAPFGYKIPLAAERGYHLMLPKAGIELRRPVVFGEPFFAATPMDEGLRLAGTAEFAHAESRPNMARAEMLLKLAQPYLPGIAGDSATTWMGVRPSFPDGMPAIGRVANAPTVFYAFGHAHCGLTTSAITAACVAAIVGARRPPVTIDPFALERFQ